MSTVTGFTHRVVTPRVCASEYWPVGVLLAVLAVATFAGGGDAYVEVILTVIAGPCHVAVALCALLLCLDWFLVFADVAFVTFATAARVA